MLWGSLAGFTSFISHAGAPPFQVYVMPQNLKPRVFAGTATMFFAAVNLIKVPPYFLLGQFSRDNLTVSAGLIPLAILSTFAGVWLVRRVSTDRFYAIILIITFVIGVKLTYDAVQALVRMTRMPPDRTARSAPGAAPPGADRRPDSRPSPLIGLVGYVVDAAITYAGAKYRRPLARTRPAARLRRRHDRQFPAQPGDHLPPFRGAARPRLRPLLSPSPRRGSRSITRSIRPACFWRPASGSR